MAGSIIYIYIYIYKSELKSSYDGIISVIYNFLRMRSKHSSIDGMCVDHYDGCNDDLPNAKSMCYLASQVANRYYLPSPPLGQDMTQGQFLSGV